MLYKSKILTLVTMVYSWHVYEYCFMGLGGRFYSYISSDVDVGTGLLLGRAPRTKETLPDFRESGRVTRHSLVFRGLTGSQQTLGIRGVTAWYQSLGIRLPRA